MALGTLISGLNAKRRALNFGGGAGVTRGISPVVQRQLKAFFEIMGQLKGNPNLLVVEFDELTSTETVISDAACKLYGIYYSKDTATLTFSKITDHASASSDTAAEYVIQQLAIGDMWLGLPNGVALANGLTMQGNTTADGGTGSASNGARGFVIVGAA